MGEGMRQDAASRINEPLIAALSDDGLIRLRRVMGSAATSSLTMATRRRCDNTVAWINSELWRRKIEREQA